MAKEEDIYKLMDVRDLTAYLEFSRTSVRNRTRGLQA